MHFNKTSGLLTITFLSCLFISGKSFGQENEIKTSSQTTPKEEVNGDVHTIVDEMAYFPDGVSALMKYLSKNIKYPKKAVKKKLEGKCYIQFVVTDTGAICCVKVKKGVPDCPECDAEAVRVIREMPHWKPGKVNGKNVNSLFSLPVSFKL